VPDQPYDNLAERISALEAELAALKVRNLRVESDKAWEVSRFRFFFLVISTYVLTAIVFLAINAPAPLLDALIPTTGYIISTQTLPVLKRWWVTWRELKS